MQSPKNNQNSALAYTALTALSVITLIVYPQSLALIGVLSILWGGLTLVRILSLYEITEMQTGRNQTISKRSNHLTSSLGYDLTSRMNTSQNMRSATQALNSLNLKSTSWLIIATIYALYSLHTKSAEFTSIMIIEQICTLFIIGAAFWHGQNYAYNKQTSHLPLFIFSALLAFSAYKNNIHTLNIDQETLRETAIAFTQNASLSILAFLLIFCASTALYSALKSFKKAPMALICCILIGAFTLIFIALPNNGNTALWLSFWGVFSLIWAKCFTDIKQHYILYQCQ